MILNVIAVDGPAAAGKGTLTRRLAQALGYDRLDTGLLYRAVGLCALETGVVPEDEAACTRLALALRADDLERDGLRDEMVGQMASKVSAVPGVRTALFEFQRSFAMHPPGGRGAVLDGRDIGTVVCPDAVAKLWLTAAPEVRARRRAAEQAARGESADVAAIAASIRERDHRETTRAVAPMIPAADALVIDTSDLDPDAVLDMAFAHVQAALNSTMLAKVA